jgi:aromatic-L-amino-acid decarboxylase
VTPDPPFDMPPEEFRCAAADTARWIADYLQHSGRYPVLPPVSPGALAAQLPSAAPAEGESIGAILADFNHLILPSLTHWNHPRFFAYFSISASAPGVLAEMLTAALNVNGMLWKSCPAATELEQVTLGWLRDALQFPKPWFGIIYDTASMSTMHAIAAARERADPNVRSHGNNGRLVLYTSAHSHSSVEKAALTLGLGRQHVRFIPVDENFRMPADALARTVDADLSQGLQPFCIVATTGTTSTSSIDPVPEIARIARQHNIWLHVDAAYGGPAAIVPELRPLFDGIELADSVVVNPHKWLFTPIDCSVLYTAHPDILRRAFSLPAEYLKTAEDTEAVNFMDYGIQLGRRFRSLKLWFVLRYFGLHRLAGMIRTHVRWADQLASLIEAHPDFEVCAPHPFSLVCFRHKSSDETNRALLDKINASGHAFLSHTVLNGKFVLRLAIGNIHTTWNDILSTWEQIQSLC